MLMARLQLMGPSLDEPPGSAYSSRETQHDFWRESLLRQDPFHLSLDAHSLQLNNLARIPFIGKQALAEGMSSHPKLAEGQMKQPGITSCFN